MFYSLLENSVNYVHWVNERKRNHSLQFQWDSEVLQFVETLEYHGGRRVVNLLRGSGHEGEGGSGIHTFDWKKWNWPLPGKTTRDSNMKGTLLKMEIILIFWSHFFFLVYKKELFHSMEMKK